MVLWRQMAVPAAADLCAHRKTGDNALMNPTEHPITEDDIANFLANTPDFFERHAEVLAAVQLSSGHGTRAVSLQEGWCRRT